MLKWEWASTIPPSLVRLSKVKKTEYDRLTTLIYAYPETNELSLRNTKPLTQAMDT
jgi:hypothetical protein